jgi:RimJ/RimL family protein N-acetyltransferase
MTQPVGVAVDTAPAAVPAPVVLEGRYARLEKLDPARHASALWQAVAGADALWTYMMAGPFAHERDFAAWVEERAAVADPYAYAVIDRRSGAASGILCLMEIRPASRVIEVGNILYGLPLQRTPAGTEAQYLAARYVFDDLGYRRYEWKCNDLNAPSKRAAERYGFIYEGTFRQHLIVKGRNRDTAWYSMLDGEWPARRAAFEEWLDPSNFDAAGNQKARLKVVQKAEK